jgi:CRISPR-associated protein Cas6
MPNVDLCFRVVGTEIPADHGYLLYAAIARVVPAFHSDAGVGVHPISGRLAGNRRLTLTDRSVLAIRLDSDRIGAALPLTGRRLDLGGCGLSVGVPEVRPLIASPAVRSRLVTIKLGDVNGHAAVTVESFSAAARRKLDELGVSPAVSLTLGKRRTLRIKDKEVVGYEVIVEGLSAAESIAVQERGLGGRRLMGCGVFVPANR